MKSAFTLWSAITVALTAGATSTQAQRGTPDPERAAARQVILAMATHIQGGNWTQADSLFATRGVHILADTAAYHSWAEYRDKQFKPDLARYSEVKLAHTGVEATVRGNVAWVAFRQEVSGGSAMARVGRGSAVLEKLGGRWTIVHLHISR
jgi:Tfp pilus assembly protein PilF